MPRYPRELLAVEVVSDAGSRAPRGWVGECSRSDDDEWPVAVLDMDGEYTHFAVEEVRALTPAARAFLATLVYPDECPAVVVVGGDYAPLVGKGWVGELSLYPIGDRLVPVVVGPSLSPHGTNRYGFEVEDLRPLTLAARDLLASLEVV